MPYEQRWIPAPSDLSLPVLKELPAGAQEWHLAHREAWASGGRHWHHCDRCGGWIEGHATEYRVNTLGILCGREGTEYYCRRCGEEIAFFGKMA